MRIITAFMLSLLISPVSQAERIKIFSPATQYMLSIQTKDALGVEIWHDKECPFSYGKLAGRIETSFKRNNVAMGVDSEIMRAMIKVRCLPDGDMHIYTAQSTLANSHLKTREFADFGSLGRAKSEDILDVIEESTDDLLKRYLIEKHVK